MKKNKPGFFKRKSTFIFLSLFSLILIARILAPSFILRHMNKYLETFSPLYDMHIDNLDLHFFRMAYSGKDIRAYLKKDQFEFISIRKVDVSLAWREIIRGRFIVDVEVLQADLKFTTNTIRAVSGYDPSQVKSDAKNVKDATIPFDLERLRLKDSTILFSDMEGLPPDQNFRLTHIDAIASNLTPKDKNGMSIFTVMGLVQENSKINIVGQTKPNTTPLDWSSTAQMRNFELIKINPIASRMVPISFKKGELSVYSSTQSVQGKIKGYVKPFFKDVAIIGDHKDFKNVKHFLFEILGTIGNFILKNRDSKAIATKVDFHSENNKLKVDTSKAVMLTIENALGDPIAPSLDEVLDLKN